MRRTFDAPELVLRAQGESGRMARALAEPLLAVSTRVEVEGDLSLLGAEAPSAACMESEAHRAALAPRVKALGAALKAGGEQAAAAVAELREAMGGLTGTTPNPNLKGSTPTPNLKGSALSSSSKLVGGDQAGYDAAQLLHHAPGELRLKLVAIYLAESDLSSARFVLDPPRPAGRLVGPPAARLRALLRSPPFLYTTRRTLLLSGHKPTRRFDSELELDPSATDDTLHAQLHEQCALAGRVCVVRGWLHAHGRAAGHHLTRDRLLERCAESEVPLSKSVGGTGRGIDALRISRNGQWVSKLKLGMFLSRPAPKELMVLEQPLDRLAESDEGSAVLDERAGRSCLEDLLGPAFTALAKGDYMRALNATHPAPAYPGGWSSSPRLSILQAGSSVGVHISGSYAHTVQVVHEGGAVDISVYPYSDEDIRSYMHPENALADGWDLEASSSPELLFEAGAGGAFPAVHPSADPRKPLLALALENRVTVSLQAGDLVFLPAGVPRSTVAAQPTVYTTLDYVDASNWEQARPHFERLADAHLVKRVDDLHLSRRRSEGRGVSPARDEL